MKYILKVIDPTLIILYLTVFQLYTVHLYLSVSRSIERGPAFSARENLVPRFPVLPFPPMRSGPAFSSPAFSTPVLFMVPRFPFPRFQRPVCINRREPPERRSAWTPPLAVGASLTPYKYTSPLHVLSCSAEFRRSMSNGWSVIKDIRLKKFERYRQISCSAR